MARDWPPVTSEGSGVDDEWQHFAGSVSALVDPGALTSASDYTAGVFSFTANTAHVTLVDGYREAMARRSFPLVDLVGEVDPNDLEGVELFFDITAKVSSTSRIGIAVGLLNAAAAGYATATGAMFSVWGIGGGSWRTADLGTLIPGTQVIPASHPTALRLLYVPIPSIGIMAMAMVRSDTGAWTRAATVAVAEPSVDLASTHVHVGMWHNATTAPAAGETWAGQVYGRRFHLGEIAP